jgi:hypothetical protein
MEETAEVSKTRRRGSWTTIIADDEAKRIATEISLHGYGTLADCVSEEEIQLMQVVAQASVQRSGGEYTHFVGLSAFAGTVLSALAESPRFNDLCRRLYEFATGKAAPAMDFYLVFRCLQGVTGQRHSYRFHYDSHIVTALLPVVIPEDIPNGNLLIIPFSRSQRRFYLSNLIDKIIIGNVIAQTILRVAARRGKMGFVSVRMRPGTIYFFLGYQSIHTNEPCKPDRLRATALFHYGDPHINSPLSLLTKGAARKLANVGHGR